MGYRLAGSIINLWFVREIVIYQYVKVLKGSIAYGEARVDRYKNRRARYL